MGGLAAFAQALPQFIVGPSAFRSSSSPSPSPSPSPEFAVCCALHMMRWGQLWAGALRGQAPTAQIPGASDDVAPVTRFVPRWRPTPDAHVSLAAPVQRCLRVRGFGDHLPTNLRHPSQLQPPRRLSAVPMERSCLVAQGDRPEVF